MRSRYAIHDPNAVYFITATIVAWLPVFTTSACCDIIVQSLIYSRQHKGLKIYAWAILDNHLHAVLSAPDLGITLTELKRFTAHQLLAQIEKEKREWLLNQLAFYRAAHKTQSDHKVWQEGSHPQEVGPDAMMEQKIDYIHNNPVARGLVVAPEHWRYSSAHEWLVGGYPCFTCDPWK